MLTLKTLTDQAVAHLAAAGIASPEFDARLLVMHALKLDRADLLSQSMKSMTGADVQKVQALLARRAAHEPVARILGEREFWSLPFGLNESTLEPRPDSETVVETVLRRLKDIPSPRLIDLGTGTGCLLLSVLHERTDATGIGVDITPRAVAQAAINAECLGLGNRATFGIGNWMDGIAEKFDAIISNPPYIPSADIARLMPEVRDHDPLRALDGGPDGLEPYRILSAQAASRLKPNGFAAFEVGIHQANAVATLCRGAGLTETEVVKDMNGIDRCVCACRP